MNALENELRKLWAKICSIHGQFVDDRSPGDFGDPVSEMELLDTEKRLGFLLPEPLRTSLAIHNGAQGLWGWMTYSSATNIHRAVSGFDETFPAHDPFRSVGPVKTVLFGPNRVPFAETPEGDCYCIDMVPEPGGTVGQIVHISWEEWLIEVLAPSYVDYLRIGIKRFEHELRYGED